MIFLRERVFGKSYCSFEPFTMMAVGAGVGAAGNIFSSIMGSSAAKKQAEAIRYAADKAAQTALEVDTRQRSDLQPYMTQGAGAVDLVGQILRGDKNLDDVLGKSSIFKWQQSEGERSINRQLAARGHYNSGVGLETLARFNTQLMGEEGERYWSKLFNTATLGGNAAARAATNTTSIGSQSINSIMQGGIAAAQSTGDQYRSLATLGPGIAGPVVGGLNSLMQYQMFQPLLESYRSGRGTGTRGALDMDFDVKGLGAFSND
jgi:hypothetical protein